jgi:hypothetical protein
MALFSWLRNSKPTRSSKPRNRRLNVEALEDRMVPSTFYAATASDVIADINAANKAGGANTIVLTAPTTSPYVMHAPVIAAGDALTIETGNGSANPGYGDTIDGGKTWRLFDVAQGASLTLENVTLVNGLVLIGGKWGTQNAALGGAIYNQGTLVLSQTMFANNSVDCNGRAHRAAGGAIWSNGSLTVENSCGFSGNSAICDYYSIDDAFGGAICIAGGTVNITNSSFGAYYPYGEQPNSALGMNAGFGGAIYVCAGTVNLSGDIIGTPGGADSAQGNLAQGFYDAGGGLYVASGSVNLTNDTFIGNLVRNENSWTAYEWESDVAMNNFGAHVSSDSFTQMHNGIPGYKALGVFATSANSVTDGASLTLTVGIIIDANPAAPTTQVAFYVQINGTNTLLGYGTQTSAGVWTLKYTVNLKPGSYTLIAQAEDSFGVFGTLMARTLRVQ